MPYNPQAAWEFLSRLTPGELRDIMNRQYTFETFNETYSTINKSDEPFTFGEPPLEFEKHADGVWRRKHGYYTGSIS